MVYGTDLTTDEADNINMSNPALGMEEVGDRIRDLERAMTRLKAEGTICVPLNSFRLTASNQTVTVGSKAGGCLANNTAPQFERRSGAQGAMTRIAWDSGVVVPIVSQISLPENLNDAATLLVECEVLKSNVLTTTKAKGTLYCEINFNALASASGLVATSGTLDASAYTTETFSYTAAQVPTAAKSMIIELYRPDASSSNCATYVNSCRIRYKRTLA
jgi:hypothetical protein